MADDKGEEMLQFKMETKPQSKPTRLPLILAVSLVILSALVAVVVIILIMKYVTLADGLQDLTVTCKQESVVKIYPGFFRSLQQQIQMEEIYRNISNIPSYGPTFRADNCTRVCQNPIIPQRKRRNSASLDFIAYVQRTYRYPTKSRTKRQFDKEKTDPPIQHGCCTSSRIFSAPDTATTVNGKEVTLVQLPDYKQYFMEETCVTVPTCTICTCAQPTPFINEAVVFKNKDGKTPEEKYEQVYIHFPGCCKCLNILSG